MRYLVKKYLRTQNRMLAII